ncbi:MAG: bifunctional DNA-binding transcriptional regulator/O6-methylguanine-DNA methyltransferase Ada [Bryobacteraceae bacterium]|jgi:AraC family transcriptional regulator of adaptative response/methylated-DNA-[protein]-cysteine methyltransferase
MDDERCWRAVAGRDAAFDGEFVFAVRSTGVYCRPSCPARRPRREQVRFFETAQAAEGAGFRACRRCRPQDRRKAESEVVELACHLLPCPLKTLAEELGLSPRRLSRMFQRLLGVTLRQYADTQRLGAFKARVRNGGEVTDALYHAGYGSSSRLYERAAAQLGMTPATYRRGGRGVRIAYSIVGCPLGRLLVAATERGICALSLGNSDAQLEAALGEEFPQAEIRRDEAGLGGWTGALVKHLEGAQPALDLALDIRATAFQRRVWEELRKIPYGGTRTYSEIARAIGRPTAARAVARACATNPVSVVIPCHRVVRGDGGLGGYRWGLERKRALLETEARCSPES